MKNKQTLNQIQKQTNESIQLYITLIASPHREKNSSKILNIVLCVHYLSGKYSRDKNNSKEILTLLSWLLLNNFNVTGILKLFHACCWTKQIVSISMSLHGRQNNAPFSKVSTPGTYEYVMLRGKSNLAGGIQVTLRQENYCRLSQWAQ